MAIEKVREYFESFGAAACIREFDVSSATVELAAQALGCAPERIATTLSFLVDGGCALVVAAGDAKVDTRKFKDKFGMKAKMLSADDVEPMTGHAIGGVCPFGVNGGVQVYCDVSLKRFQYVYPAAGNAHSGVKLTCDELFGAADALEWVDVCKGWE